MSLQIDCVRRKYQMPSVHWTHMVVDLSLADGQEETHMSVMTTAPQQVRNGLTTVLGWCVAVTPG